MAAGLRAPDLDAQRAAMAKLDFLIGSWAGEAWVLRGPGTRVELIQTEEVQYKLDGLVLTIEGVGRAKSDGSAVLQALGVLSYDDESATYRMRAFNDGRFLETEVRLLESGLELTWGFRFGEIQTSSLLRMTDKGEWTESGELTIGGQGPIHFMELSVSRRALAG